VKASGCMLQSAVTTTHLLSRRVAVKWGRFYFSSPFWYRALSLRMCALCAYSTFGHHPHPRLPLCQILFLSRPHCWASRRRKIGYTV